MTIAEKYKLTADTYNGRVTSSLSFCGAKFHDLRPTLQSAKFSEVSYRDKIGKSSILS